MPAIRQPAFERSPSRRCLRPKSVHFRLKPVALIWIQRAKRDCHERAYHIVEISHARACDRYVGFAARSRVVIEIDNSVQAKGEQLCHASQSEKNSGNAELLSFLGEKAGKAQRVA
jgi:hypothetical protein